MINIVNTNHSTFVDLWDSQIAFNNDTALPEHAAHAWPELQSVLNDDFANFDQGWYFENDAGMYIVARVNDKYLTFSGYPYTEVEAFDTLKEALTTAFSFLAADSLPNGEWNDEVTEFSVDGEWLIREVQS